MAKKIDPVCGMSVDTGTKLVSEYKGEKYYFCNEHCKHQFDASPVKYTR